MHSNQNTRIIEGKNSSIEEFPYLVSIQFKHSSNYYHYCSGGIISKLWVLTSASCTISIGTKIRAGSSFYNNGSIHIAVQLIKHEKFHWMDYPNRISVNDIQLVRVNRPFEFDRTRQPMKLFEAGEKVNSGFQGNLAGWGFTEDNQFSLNLRSVLVPIVSKKKCSEKIYALGGFPIGQICAGYEEGGPDACLLDTGSPLAVSGRIVGFVSWAYGCGASGYYGIYTEVAAYRSWIDKKLKL